MDQSQAALRHFISAGVILFPLVCSPPHPARADDIGANQSELIQRLLPTVVNILVTKDEPLDVSAAAPADAAAPAPPPDATPNIRAYAGSGFVIDRSGLIVTNYHVVQNAFEINVTFSDGSRLPGTMLQASRLADLAILKVDAGHPLQEAHWGDSSRLRVGQQVFAAGNPLGIGLSVSAGIISALNRDIQNSPFDDLIQTDATINHGNSGGPLFNMQGEVIGVDSNIISPTSGSSGLGFAVPSATARFVVDQLMKYGWIRPAWIGVKVQTVTPELADAMGGTSPPGTSVISWVVADSPGDKAGLQIGDVIERYDGIVPTDDRNLLRQIAHTPIGEKISFLVRRNGAERTVLVATETWPRDRWDSYDAPLAVQRPKIVISPDLGLDLAALSVADRAILPSAPGANGVLVTRVAPNSEPAHRGMASGDVILRVQEKLVATPDEVRAAIDAVRAANRAHVMMLVLPKKSDVPGPNWVALRVVAEGG